MGNVSIAEVLNYLTDVFVVVMKQCFQKHVFRIPASVLRSVQMYKWSVLSQRNYRLFHHNLWFAGKSFNNFIISIKQEHVKVCIQFVSFSIEFVP